MRLRQTKNKTSPCCSSFTCRDFVHTWSWCFSMPTAVLPRLSGIFFPFLSSCIRSCSTVSSQYHWPFLYERVHQALIFSQVTKWCFAAWSRVLLLNCHQDFPLYTACFLDSLHSLDLIIIKGSSVKGGRLWRPTFFFSYSSFMEIPEGYLIQESWHLDFFVVRDCLFFLSINIIVVISFTVSEPLNCREFKQLVAARDSGGALKVLFPFAYITWTRA